MKKTILSLCCFTAALLFSSCEDDQDVSCIVCSSPETASFELCRDQNGNATVNGENTNTDYDEYLAGLQESGVACGDG